MIVPDNRRRSPIKRENNIFYGRRYYYYSVRSFYSSQLKKKRLLQRKKYRKKRCQFNCRAIILQQLAFLFLSLESFGARLYTVGNSLVICINRTSSFPFRSELFSLIYISFSPSIFKCFVFFQGLGLICLISSDFGFHLIICFACLNSSATVGNHRGKHIFLVLAMIGDRPRLPLFIILIRRNSSESYIGDDRR